MINIRETFTKFNAEIDRFDLVQDKLHLRPDMCALLLLDRLLPCNSDTEYIEILIGADYDEVSSDIKIFLDVDLKVLAEVATKEDILALVRCGVGYSDLHASLFFTM